MRAFEILLPWHVVNLAQINLKKIKKEAKDVYSSSSYLC